MISNFIYMACSIWFLLGLTTSSFAGSANNRSGTRKLLARSYAKHTQFEAASSAENSRYHRLLSNRLQTILKSLGSKESSGTDADNVVAYAHAFAKIYGDTKGKLILNGDTLIKWVEERPEWQSGLLSLVVSIQKDGRKSRRLSVRISIEKDRYSVNESIVDLISSYAKEPGEVIFVHSLAFQQVSR